jgi:glycosyltransferase involved in cell wall biosynthesis
MRAAYLRIGIMAPLVTAIREPQQGGSRAFVADLARGLTGRGHEVHVYAAAGSQIPDVEVIDTGIDPRSLAGTLYRAFGSTETAPAGAPAAAEAAFTTAYLAMQVSRYDVIHNHAFDAPAVRLATALRAPVVHTLHLPPDQAVSAALRHVARRARPPAVAVVSAAQARAWRQVVPVDAVLPPYPPVRDIPWSQAPGPGALFAGRLARRRARPRPSTSPARPGCRSRSTGTPTTLTTPGSRSDPRRGWPAVTVHRAVPRAELWPAMGRAAVVLCPSRWDEPFGLAAAEAQACGTPSGTLTWS